jgi:hypothetical protein
MAMEKDLGTLIRLLNPYADTMHLSTAEPPNAEGVQALIAGAQPTAPSDILVEAETRQVEYLSWQFKDLPRRVKKAIRVTYRHPVRKDNAPDGAILCWVTEHLLIGYEGSNGG